MHDLVTPEAPEPGEVNGSWLCTGDEQTGEIAPAIRWDNVVHAQTMMEAFTSWRR